MSGISAEVEVGTILSFEAPDKGTGVDVYLDIDDAPEGMRNLLIGEILHSSKGLGFFPAAGAPVALGPKTLRALAALIESISQKEN